MGGLHIPLRRLVHPGSSGNREGCWQENNRIRLAFQRWKDPLAAGEGERSGWWP